MNRNARSAGTRPEHDPVQGAWDLDQSLIEAVLAGAPAQVAVYPHRGVACVVGRGGDTWIETWPDLLRADGVALLRRRGGGCAVVLDPGNIVCSVVLPQPGVGGITSTFERLSEILSGGLAACGLPGVRRQGTSDLAIGDRKLGGACIWRTRGLLYYTTTILVDPSWDLIERYLPHPPREPAYRRGRRHREFLTSTSAEGLPSSPGDLADRLRRVVAAAIARLPA